MPRRVTRAWPSRSSGSADYPEEVIHAVLAHAEYMGVPRESLLDKALFGCDELAGFITACAYVRPEGINGMKPKSVKKKLKQPSFAAAVNRDDIQVGAEELGAETGLDFDEHLAARDRGDGRAGGRARASARRATEPLPSVRPFMRT